MRYLAPTALAIIVAIGGNVAIYAHSVRERPRRSWCGFSKSSERPEREAAARFESDLLRAAAFVVNGTALASVFASLARRRRDVERAGSLENDGMSERADKPDEKRGRWARTASIMAALLLLYPLSGGPVAWLFENRYLQRAPDWVIFSAERFYAPCAWLRTKVQSFDASVDWYMHLWVPRR